MLGRFATVVAQSSDPCLVASATPLYSSSTVSALISVTSGNCGSGGLSTGAIVGIAVGAAVGGLLLAIIVYFITRSQLRKRQKRLVEKMRKSELDAVQSSLNQISVKQEENASSLNELDSGMKTLSTAHMQQLIQEKKIAETIASRNCK